MPIQGSPVVLYTAIIRETQIGLKASPIGAGGGAGDMQNQRYSLGLGGGGGLWLLPAFLGLLLIVFGVLIFVVPKLLELIVAAVLVAAGCSLLGLAWHLRSRVTYRRMDYDGPGTDGLGDF